MRGEVHLLSGQEMLCMARPLSKKAFARKKGGVGVTVHLEGCHVCNCLTRGFRKWLGVKRYGQDPEHELVYVDGETGERTPIYGLFDPRRVQGQAGEASKNRGVLTEE